LDKKEATEIKTISEFTEGMEVHFGYFTYYWESKEGKIWLKIDKFDTEFLYVNGLKAGLGSNDIGLDRNQLGSTCVVMFQRIGPKVLLTEVNYGYRALSDNPKEKKAVEEAFAKSVLGGFTIKAEEEGKVLVDVTDFFLRDAKGVIQRLKEKEQGEYELDPERCAIYLPATKNFPKNTEVEAILTYKGKEPGDWVKSVAPDPENITIRQHHSLIELPPEGYKPRKFDIRSSYFSLDFMDYATPITEPLKKRYICRHRLKKKDPSAKISEPMEPITYYVDPGVPEPIRSALEEGASWWDLAFENIGYKNAFKVEILPDHADPMDIRYNVINWVHRRTRGWSYGMTVTDPRTGEIIKGHVSLGSLRIRQDFLIAIGLVGEYNEDGDNTSEALEMALARIRQLSVHEVGHTLGLGHNYASNINARASVMDYPAMLVKEKDGMLDLSEAYKTGVGEWDLVSIEYGYQDYPDEVEEEVELDRLLNNAFDRGLLYQPSRDAGPGSASPYAAYWINGVDPVDELYRIMRVRSIALDTFGEHRIKFGVPLAELEEPLVTTYLFHRFQLESTASVLGGLYYHYKVRGDVQDYLRFVPEDIQKSGLEALLETISPHALEIPKSLRDLMHPRPQHLEQTRDLFPGRTGLTFDPMAAAETAAAMTVSLILHPERAARLVEFSARDPELPGLGFVIDRLFESTWMKIHEDPYHKELQRLVNYLVLYYMVELVKNNCVPAIVNSLAFYKFRELRKKVGEFDTEDESQLSQYIYLDTIIERLEKDPESVNLTPPAEPPMGAPI
jgi:hypothetical protein